MKILIDVDGVVLDWEPAFDAWIAKQGFRVKKPDVYSQYVRYGFQRKKQCDILVKQFNESAWIGYLKPLRDSVEWVRKLRTLNYTFDAITSLSEDECSSKLRAYNLEQVFGAGTFDRVLCIGTGADKDEALAEYDKGHWWVEDKPLNCDAGLRAGHKPIIISHKWNLDYDNPDVQRAENWKDIYNIITATYFK